MTEQVKFYAGLLAAILFGVLILIIWRKNKTVSQLENENASLKIDKELTEVKKKADEAVTTYEEAKRNYDDFKRNNPSLFNRPK
jgi:predicted negative regulator of RcsB-dependent stress response